MAGRRVAVGNRKLMVEDNVDFPAALMARRDELASTGRTAVLVAVDGRGVGVIALADAAKPPPKRCRTCTTWVCGWSCSAVTTRPLRHASPISSASTPPSPRCCPGTRPPRSPSCRPRAARPRWSVTGSTTPGAGAGRSRVAIGAGTDVAIETADLVLMRSDPLDVPIALRIGRGTLRKMRQNLWWAVGYNVIALPIAAGVLVPAFGFALRPEIAAMSMSGSSLIVAVNALMLKRLKLPAPPASDSAAPPDGAARG